MAIRGTDIFSVLPETVHLAANATLTINALPGQVAVTLKYSSGGTLSILGTTLTLKAVNYGVASPNISALKYVVGTSEILNFDGAGSFVLLAEGATVVFQMLRGRASALDS